VVSRDSKSEGSPPPAGSPFASSKEINLCGAPNHLRITNQWSTFRRGPSRELPRMLPIKNSCVLTQGLLVDGFRVVFASKPFEFVTD
jgi:hypothetical protein